MSATYKRFSFNVRRCCPKNGKSVLVNVQLLGLNRKVLYQDDRVNYPRTETVITLCKAWGCTPNDLLEGLY